MTTRNFTEIADLLAEGRRLQPTDADNAAVVRRGLEKLAPFHKPKNSVADAVLIELYATALERCVGRRSVRLCDFQLEGLLHADRTQGGAAPGPCGALHRRALRVFHGRGGFGARPP